MPLTNVAPTRYCYFSLLYSVIFHLLIVKTAKNNFVSLWGGGGGGKNGSMFHILGDYRGQQGKYDRFFCIVYRIEWICLFHFVLWIRIRNFLATTINFFKFIPPGDFSFIFSKKVVQFKCFDYTVLSQRPSFHFISSLYTLQNS